MVRTTPNEGNFTPPIVRELTLDLADSTAAVSEACLIKALAHQASPEPGITPQVLRREFGPQLMSPQFRTAWAAKERRVLQMLEALGINRAAMDRYFISERATNLPFFNTIEEVRAFWEQARDRQIALRQRVSPDGLGIARRVHLESGVTRAALFRGTYYVLSAEQPVTPGISDLSATLADNTVTHSPAYFHAQHAQVQSRLEELMTSGKLLDLSTVRPPSLVTSLRRQFASQIRRLRRASRSQN